MADQASSLADDIPESPLEGSFDEADTKNDQHDNNSHDQNTNGQVSVPPITGGSRPSRSSLSSLGPINAARRSPNQSQQQQAPRPIASMSTQSVMNQDIVAKMRAFHLSRQSSPVHPAPSGISAVGDARIPSRQPSSAVPVVGGAMAGRMPPSAVSNPRSPSMVGVGAGPTTPRRAGGLAGKRNKPGLKLADATGSPTEGSNPDAFSRYAEYIDTKAGTLNFKNKAVLHGGGIEFSSGQSFSISLDEVDRLDELGKGNYGTVYKVRHSRPHMRRPGVGISGIVSRSENSTDDSSASSNPQLHGLTGVVMAMKEIRLELDESKFAQIIMELDILHRCLSPFIIDFYGAFFQEGAVYICVEYMDGGSIDKVYKNGVPENILRKVALSTVMGLGSLKDDHNIIHRDVKPTNILVNTKGQIKICDFGVSGNLVASMAKTNIGCQSYMAPERIAGGGIQQSGAASSGAYSVQSDIWSLGLAIVECAKGRYPYPPEAYNNIFSQLHVSNLSTGPIAYVKLTDCRLLFMATHRNYQKPDTQMKRILLSQRVWTKCRTSVLHTANYYDTHGLRHCYNVPKGLKIVRNPHKRRKVSRRKTRRLPIGLFIDLISRSATSCKKRRSRLCMRWLWIPYREVPYWMSHPLSAWIDKNMFILENCIMLAHRLTPINYF